MNRPIGYSTGSLGKADFRRALEVLAAVPVTCVELSALRIAELPVIIAALEDLDLSSYTYVSFHAPSQFGEVSEADVLELLAPVREREWPIIMHPDAIRDYALWRDLGPALCIENMDKRKRTGRNVTELSAIFDCLPEAELCFDIAHARQLDPTMSQASMILSAFSDRIRQVHLSSLDVRSTHHPLNVSAILAYQRVGALIPHEIPIILESPLLDHDGDDPAGGVRRELDRAAEALSV